jgi:hypothetical protein
MKNFFLMTPFDFLKLVHNKKTNWSELTEDEQKAWNTFIINKALSFNSNYLDIINKIQPYTGGQLTPSEIFKYYQSMLPSNFRFQKWIKGNKTKSYNPDMIELISSYLECSRKQAEDYLKILDKREIKSLLKHIGIQDDQIKKLMKK